jgi:hypothetical protein
VTSDELRVTNEEALLTHHSSLATCHLSDGRFVVPLPHPSGASLWPNKPENRALIQRAIALLRDIRVTHGL